MPFARKPVNIALIGASGSGKGTHVASLSDRFRLRNVATGDVLRQNLQARSALGILARKYMEQGELVPDEVVDAMIEEWCGKLAPDEAALFDGFPRTAYQAWFLDELLGRLGRALDGVVYLHVSDDEIVRRLAGRLMCGHCQATWHAQYKAPQQPGLCDRCGGDLHRRPDDSTAIVDARLRTFHRTTGAVIDHYVAASRLVIVDGHGTPADVEQRLVAAVEGVRDRSARFATRDDAALLATGVGTVLKWEKYVRPSIDIVLLGGPGSGKGTQAQELSAELKLAHIATGDLFRDNLKRATELGQLAKTYMDRGELVPDDVTEAMVEERLACPDARDGFILDGFPRTLPQAHSLTEMMGHLHQRLTGVLYISVSDDAIVSRLSGRLICRNCQAPYHFVFNQPKQAGTCDQCGGELYQRADDNATTVRARLATFHGQTEPLIEYYRGAGLLHEIDGEGDIAAVSARSLAAVRHFTQS